MVKGPTNAKTADSSQNRQIINAGFRLASCFALGYYCASQRWLHTASADSQRQNAVTLSSPSVDNAVDEGSGWKSIHVFYGSDKHLGGTRHKSQCGQDRLVTGLLKGRRKGFFVDLAANDATELSNTFPLERDFDWRGLCFEPNPRYWPRLALRKCTLVAAVVGNQAMEEVNFIMHEGTGRHPGGGIEDPAFDNKPDKPKSRDKPVKLFTTTLLDAFSRFRVPSVIDYSKYFALHQGDGRNSHFIF